MRILRFTVYFVDDIKDTTTSLKSAINQYEIDQLKISAAVSSLELFCSNQTQSKYGMYNVFVNQAFFALTILKELNFVRITPFLWLNLYSYCITCVLYGIGRLITFDVKNISITFRLCTFLSHS